MSYYWSSVAKHDERPLASETPVAFYLDDSHGDTVEKAHEEENDESGKDR